MSTGGLCRQRVSQPCKYFLDDPNSPWPSGGRVYDDVGKLLYFLRVALNSNPSRVLSGADKTLHTFLVSLVHQCSFAEAAFAFRRLLREDMTVIRLFALQSSGSRHVKTLLRPAI